MFMVIREDVLNISHVRTHYFVVTRRMSYVYGMPANLVGYCMTCSNNKLPISLERAE